MEADTGVIFHKTKSYETKVHEGFFYKFLLLLRHFL